MPKPSLTRVAGMWTLVTALIALAGTTSLSSAAQDRPRPRERHAAARSEQEARENMTRLTRKAQEPYRPKTLWFGDSASLCFYGQIGGQASLLTREYYSPDTPPDLGTFLTYDQLGNQVLFERRWSYEFQYKVECRYASGGDLHKGQVVFMQEWQGDSRRGAPYYAAYNANGQLDVEHEDYDFDRDGSVDAIAWCRYVYDAGGYLIAQLFENDDDANGTIDYRYGAFATYDARHRMVRLVKGYNDGPGGSFVPYHTWWITFDDAARSSVAFEETDGDGDGISDYTFRWTTFLDEQGRTIRFLHDSDYWGRPDGGADGIFDGFGMDVSEYDAAGNLAHFVMDRWGSDTLTFRDDYLYTYDAKDRLVHGIYTTWTWLPPSSWFPDGTVVEDGSTTVYNRDMHGRVVEEVTVWHQRTDRSTFRYDGMGNVIENTTTTQFNNEPPELWGQFFMEYAAGRSGQPRGQ